MDIPEDLDSAIREIDSELKAEGIKPHQRSVHAIRRFGQRFKVFMPVLPVDQTAGPELYSANKYCDAIHNWYQLVYGDLMQVDFLAERSVAVIADSDSWELELPLLYGSANISASHRLSQPQEGVRIGSVQISVPDHLQCITQARLYQFDSDDLLETVNQFLFGMKVCNWLERARDQNPLFRQASSDLSDAVRHFCAQTPNYGQSRWSTLMFVEKFMKGVIVELGLGDPEHTHNLARLMSKISEAAPNLGLSGLLTDIQCSADTRYGLESTREEAYAAHKASLKAAQKLSGLVSLRRPAFSMFG